MNFSTSLSLKAINKNTDPDTLRNIKVNLAVKAEQDSLGNNISNTYVTKDALAQSLNSIKSGLGDTIKKATETSKLKPNEVLESNVSDNAITTNKVKDGSITGNKLENIHSDTLSESFISVDRHGRVTKLSSVDEAVNNIIKGKYAALHQSLETNVSAMAQLRNDLESKIKNVQSTLTVQNESTDGKIKAVERQMNTTLPTALSEVSKMQETLKGYTSQIETLKQELATLREELRKATAPKETDPNADSAVTVIEYTE